MARASVSPAEIQKHLKGMDYPARKPDLIKHAKGQGADENVVAILQELPDQEFHTAADVSKAIGEVE
ncbi:DUF2795 domain-containing protein [Candidatus Methylocalor cossyra]|uniref:DUF2795 domain-containing protein n=1 Tax=Candidatus Methylocalor cossyra TaxID=3108543 RepID=UPI0032B23FB0